jgi:hypothetical protein
MGHQIIDYESGRYKIHKPKQIINQNIIRLAIRMRIYDERQKMGLPQSELKMRSSYLQNNDKGNTKETTIHVTEIGKAIKILKQNEAKNSQHISHTAGNNGNTTAKKHRQIKKGKRTKHKAGLEIGDSHTRIDPCDSCSEDGNNSNASGNDSADSNSSLCRRLKIRVRAQRAWIKLQSV